MEQGKWAWPLVILSVVAAGAFGVQIWREHTRIHRLTLSTASPTGEYYAFGQAFAQVIATHHADIQITVAESQGSLDNLERIDRGTAQLALIQSDSPVNPSTRAVSYLFPEMAHVVISRESGIESFADLKDHRLALMSEGSGSYKLFWPIAAHYALTPEDLDYIAVPTQQAYAAFRSGEVDALFQVMALGNGGLRQLLQQEKADLLPIDQVAALQLTLPYLEATQIPKGTYDGAIPIPAQDLTAVGVRAVLIARADVDAGVIYRLTESLYQFRSELVSLYPRAATIILPESGENLGLPLHPGARAFYDQDQPNFLVQYAEPMGLLLSIAVLGISGLWQVRLWLIGRQKNRADMYNLQLLELIDRIQESQDLQQLLGHRQELFEILRQVVVDLDEDRISAESFQSFTLPWEVAISSLRHRETILWSQDQR